MVCLVILNMKLMAPHEFSLFILPFLGTNNFYNYPIFSIKSLDKEVFTYFDIMHVLLNSLCSQKIFLGLLFEIIFHFFLLQTVEGNGADCK